MNGLTPLIFQQCQPRMLINSRFIPTINLISCMQSTLPTARNRQQVRKTYITRAPWRSTSSRSSCGRGSHLSIYSIRTTNCFSVLESRTNTSVQNNAIPEWFVGVWIQSRQGRTRCERDTNTWLVIIVLTWFFWKRKHLFNFSISIRRSKTHVQKLMTDVRR